MEYLERVLYYLLSMELTDIVDMAIIACLVYQLLALVKNTSSERVLKGVLFVILALWLSSEWQLSSLNFVLNKLVEWGVLALVILFQPEIRRILDQLGGSRFSFLRVFSRREQASTFERQSKLDDVLRSGTKLDAEPSTELLKNVFFVKAPMHDGAMIIRDGRVLGAGCMLPLSRNVNLSRDLGMRHRAGIGMSENSDAVVVLVSEETGSISVAVGGMLKRHLSIETLRLLLSNELLPKEENQTESKKKFQLKDLVKRKKEKYE